MRGRHDDYGYPQRSGAEFVWVTTGRGRPFGFEPPIERELDLVRRSSACAECGERDDANRGLTSSNEMVIVRPKGVSRAVTTRQNSRILGPGMQILSDEAAAELAALEAQRNSPEHRAKVRLKELPLTE